MGDWVKEGSSLLVPAPAAGRWLGLAGEITKPNPAKALPRRLRFLFQLGWGRCRVGLASLAAV